MNKDKKKSKGNIDALFICYSQIHLLISSCIQKELGYKNYTILLNKELINIKKSKNIIDFEYSSFDKNLFLKLKSWFKLFLYYPRFGFIKNIYIPNDSDPFVGFIISKYNYKELHYIDEGNLALTLSRGAMGGVQSSNSFYSKLLSKIFKFKLSKYILESNAFKTYWIYFPKIVTKYRNIKGEINDLKFLFNKNLEEKYITTKNYKKIDVVILGSPLTENNFLNDNKEIKIVEEYLKELLVEDPNIKILIKPHYREKIKKYNYLLDNIKNISIMEGSDLSIPYQVIHQKIKPNIVLGFYSSAMLVENCKVISLLKKVPIKKEIYGLIKGLELMKKEGFNIEL